MQMKASVRRGLLGSVIYGLSIAGTCVVSLLCSPVGAQEQSLSEPSLALLPLEETSFSFGNNALPLEAIATDLNTQVAIDIAKLEEVEGLTLEDIPIIRDFVDEKGNMDMTGGSLPVSVGVSNFMEAYGVVVSTDFHVP